jgi:hypothetical protein
MHLSLMQDTDSFANVKLDRYSPGMEPRRFRRAACARSRRCFGNRGSDPLSDPSLRGGLDTHPREALGRPLLAISANIPADLSTPPGASTEFSESSRQRVQSVPYYNDDLFLLDRFGTPIFRIDGTPRAQVGCRDLQGKGDRHRWHCATKRFRHDRMREPNRGAAHRRPI